LALEVLPDLSVILGGINCDTVSAIDKDVLVGTIITYKLAAWLNNDGLGLIPLPETELTVAGGHLS